MSNIKNVQQPQKGDTLRLVSGGDIIYGVYLGEGQVKTESGSVFALEEFEVFEIQQVLFG